MIIHIITSLKRGGRERQLATIASSTNQENYPTKIIYFNLSDTDYISEYCIADISVRITATSFLQRLLELSSLLTFYKADIVYSWGNFESLLVLLLKPFHEFKFINGSIRHGIRSKKLSHYFRTVVLLMSPNIVANSYAGLKANNLRNGDILYNGLDSKFICKPTETQKRQIKALLLDIHDKFKLLISVANLVPYKDYFSIIDALSKIKHEGFFFHYLILGEGPLRKEIENRIIQKDLTSEIRIVGNVQNVNEFLQAADIFIHSSKGEGCSNAILEAMAAGLPIIASNTGGTSEIVSNESGFLFEYKNVQQLKEIIIRLLIEPQTIEKYGEKSFLKVKERFTVSAMMNNYYKIINKIGGARLMKE